MSTMGPLRGAFALIVLLLAVAGAGRAIGIGPLSGVVPASQVTDPGEVMARSLQATLDADSVHVEGALDGTLPGALLEREGGPAVLDGTLITADLRPRDAQTQFRVLVPALGADLETITDWTDAWFRSSGGPWQKAAVSEATSGTGVDLNPLTLVDRVRSYLAGSAREPTWMNVACESASGRCHEVRLDMGTDPAWVLAAMLPGASKGFPPAVSVAATVRADVVTLKPTSLVVVAASDDRTIDLRLLLVFEHWDEPVRIDVPPAGDG